MTAETHQDMAAGRQITAAAWDEIVPMGQSARETLAAACSQLPGQEAANQGAACPPDRFVHKQVRRVLARTGPVVTE